MADLELGKIGCSLTKNRRAHSSNARVLLIYSRRNDAHSTAPPAVALSSLPSLNVHPRASLPLANIVAAIIEQSRIRVAFDQPVQCRAGNSQRGS
jgi:hypothetical protein